MNNENRTIVDLLFKLCTFIFLACMIISFIYIIKDIFIFKTYESVFNWLICNIIVFFASLLIGGATEEKMKLISDISFIIAIISVFTMMIIVFIPFIRVIQYDTKPIAVFAISLVGYSLFTS